MTSLASSVLLYADRSLLGFCVFVKLGIYYLFKHPCFYFPTFSFYPLSLIFLIPFSTYFPPPMSSSPLLFSSLPFSHWDCVPYMSKPVLTGVWCQLICCGVDRRMAALNGMHVCVCVSLYVFSCVCLYVHLSMNMSETFETEGQKWVFYLKHVSALCAEVPRKWSCAYGLL